MLAQIEINDSTPVAMLTLGQLKEALQGMMQPSAPAAANETEKTEVYDGERFLHGIDGIAQFFGVSRTTAQIYKDGFLQPAVTQYGRKILVDKVKAMELFNQNKTK